MFMYMHNKRRASFAARAEQVDTAILPDRYLTIVDPINGGGNLLHSNHL